MAPYLSFFLVLAFLSFSEGTTPLSCDPISKTCTSPSNMGVVSDNFQFSVDTSSWASSFPSNADSKLFVQIEHQVPIFQLYLSCGFPTFERVYLYGWYFFLEGGHEEITPQTPNLLNGTLFTSEAGYYPFNYPDSSPAPAAELKPWAPYGTSFMESPLTPGIYFCDFFSTAPVTINYVEMIFANLEDPCDPNPCQNGGVCSSSDNVTYQCDCAGTGFMGADCGSCVDISTNDLNFFDGTTSLSVVLTTQPTQDVMVVLSSDCVLLSDCVLTFTPSDWNTPQTIAVVPMSLDSINTTTGSPPYLDCLVSATVISSDLCNDNSDQTFAGTFGPPVIPEGQENTGSSCGDPHLRTFDGNSHSSYDIGDFYLAREHSGNFTVQARQDYCNVHQSASCNSAVAIRSGTAVVYFPDLSGSPGFHIVGNALQNGITVQGSGNTFTVSLFGGVSINIVFYPFFILIIDVYVTLPDSLVGHVSGLLGYYSHQRGDDFMFPNGTLSSSIPEFQESWRVPTSENLFLDPAAVIPDISSSFPPGSTNSTPSFCSLNSATILTGSLQNLGGGSPLSNSPVPFDPNFQIPSCYDNATLLAEAQAFCSPYFSDSVAQCCESLGVNSTSFETNCVCDYVLSGGPAFSFSAVNNFYAACESEETSQQTSCEACPSSCSGNGICGAGGICSCTSPFQGDDCSENWGQNPMITSASQNSGSGCPRTVTISGNYFYGVELSCEFNNGGVITTIPATKVSNFMLVCDLPLLSSPGSVSLSVKVIRSDSAQSSLVSFSALPSCCNGPCIRGTCTNDNVLGFTCSCPSGFGGDLCEIDLSATTQPPTTQSPTTQPPTTQPPTTQSPTTQPPTTQSPTTQPPTTQPPLPCDSFPCLNSGVCTNVGASAFSCSCPSGISGDTCEFAGPTISLAIITSTKAGSGTTSEILVTFVGSTGTSGPHSLGSSFTEGGSNQINNLQLFNDIGVLYALDLVNTGSDMWRVQSIDVTGDLTGTFGWDMKVKDTRTLEQPFQIDWVTDSGVDDGCLAPIYIRVVDDEGKSFEALLGNSFSAGQSGSVTIPYLNSGVLAKINLGSFSEDTWNFISITITRRGVSYVFLNTLGAPFSRIYHLAQFFPQ